MRKGAREQGNHTLLTEPSGLGADTLANACSGAATNNCCCRYRLQGDADPVSARGQAGHPLSPRCVPKDEGEDRRALGREAAPLLNAAASFNVLDRNVIRNEIPTGTYEDHILSLSRGASISSR
jgi:hypothetical protein